MGFNSELKGLRHGHSVKMADYSLENVPVFK
jgi:hypothetical protein